MRSRIGLGLGAIGFQDLRFVDDFDRNTVTGKHAFRIKPRTENEKGHKPRHRSGPIAMSGHEFPEKHSGRKGRKNQKWNSKGRNPGSEPPESD